MTGIGSILLPVVQVCDIFSMAALRIEQHDGKIAFHIADGIDKTIFGAFEIATKEVIGNCAVENFKELLPLLQNDEYEISVEREEQTRYYKIDPSDDNSETVGRDKIVPICFTFKSGNKEPRRHELKYSAQKFAYRGKPTIVASVSVDPNDDEIAEFKSEAKRLKNDKWFRAKLKNDELYFRIGDLIGDDNLVKSEVLIGTCDVAETTNNTAWSLSTFANVLKCIDILDCASFNLRIGRHPPKDMSAHYAGVSTTSPDYMFVDFINEIDFNTIIRFQLIIPGRIVN